MKRAIDLPWGFQHPDTYYDSKTKVTFYKGSTLPASLRRFAAPDFSYARWIEDEGNGTVLPPEKGAFVFVPKKHQIEGAKRVFKSYYDGWPGFLLADKTGLGKTLTCLAGISAIAKNEGFTPKNKAKLLVVCPKGVIPQWRNTLHNYPKSTALLRPMVINYQQLNKLLETPKTSRMKDAKKRKTKNRVVASTGKPLIDWDFIVFDEAHALKNFPATSTAVAAVNIAKLNKPYARTRSPYVIFSTATPGASPLNFGPMAKILAPLISTRPEAKKVTPDTWGEFLLAEGFAVKKGKVNWSWAPPPFYGKNSDDPKERERYNKSVMDSRRLQRRDTAKIGRGLKKPQAPFIMRSPKDLEGWPEQQLIPFPIEMTTEQIPVYEDAWSRFRNWLKLTPAKSDPKGALIEMLRYRQKTSLIKVQHLIDPIAEWVADGNQVYVSCQFIETIEEYGKLLTAKKIPWVEISGRNSGEREEARMKFQKGQAKVVLCTVVAGISLHAEEMLPDGTKATAAQRISIINDVRQNNLDTEQACGRAHRDGVNSLTYFPYLIDTVDENVISSHTNKQANMQSMMGASLEEAEDMERIFREAAERRAA